MMLGSETAERLAKALSELTGETEEEAIVSALTERLEREQRRRAAGGLAERLLEIGRHCASLPDLDPRTPDEIVGYDETGMWR